MNSTDMTSMPGAGRSRGAAPLEAPRDWLGSASDVQVEGVVGKPATEVLRFHVYAVRAQVSTRREHQPGGVNQAVRRVTDRRRVAAAPHIAGEQPLVSADPQPLRRLHPEAARHPTACVY